MTPRRFVSLVVLLVGLAWAGPAWGRDAAPKPGGDAHAADHAGDNKVKVHVHTAEGEKELKLDLNNEADRKTLAGYLEHGHVHELKKDTPPDLLTLKWDLGLWSVVVFLVLFFVLSKYAWPQILEGLQAREGNIQGALDEAEKTRAEARSLKDDLAKQMAGAADKVREIMDEARKDAARTTEDMISKARTEIHADRDRLKRELESAKDSALKELWDNSVKLASMISTKAIKKSVDSETHQRLFDDALAELSVQEKLLKG